MIIFTILTVLITILVLVLIHECGHFLAAKKFNIKVLEFGFGIPPRVFGKKIGETLVSLNWIPLGGFVRLLGEDEVDSKRLNDPRSFASQNVWKRIAVVTAGVGMNLLLAWILYTVLLAVQGFKIDIPLLMPQQFIGVRQVDTHEIYVGEVITDSPAAQAHLNPGDKIVGLNGTKITDADSFISQVKQEAGQTVKLTVLTDKNQTKELSLTPRKNPPTGQGALGVSLAEVSKATLFYESWWQRALVGPIHSLNMGIYSIRYLGHIIAVAIAKKTLAPVTHGGVGGIIAVGFVTSQIVKLPNPILPMVDLMATLSFTLALFNLLPLPALDGGRLAFLLVEAVIRKKVNPELEKKIHAIGMVALLGLMVLITFSDFQTYILGK